MQDKNGSTALAGDVGVVVNRQLVQLLESALADAKSGKLVGGAVIALLGGESFVCFGADGGHGPTLLAGTVMLQSDTLAKMRQPRVSPIMRPGVGRG